MLCGLCRIDIYQVQCNLMPCKFVCQLQWHPQQQIEWTIPSWTSTNIHWQGLWDLVSKCSRRQKFIFFLKLCIYAELHNVMTMQSLTFNLVDSFWFLSIEEPSIYRNDINCKMKCNVGFIMEFLVETTMAQATSITF